MLFGFPTIHVVFMQIARLTQTLTIKIHIRVFTFVSSLGFALFIITIKAHSFSNLGLISVWTRNLFILLFLLFFELRFQDVKKVINGCEDGLTWLRMLEEILLQVEAVRLHIFHELSGRQDLLIRRNGVTLSIFLSLDAGLSF